MRPFPLLLALLMILMLDRAAAQVPVPATAAANSVESVRLFPVIISSDDAASAGDAAIFAEELRASLEKRLRASDYAVVLAEEALSPDLPEPSQAADLARGAGQGWATVCALNLAEGRLSYRIAIYDSADGGLAAGDSFSVLADLGALRTMDDSAATAATRLADYRAGHAGRVRTVVSYRIAVSCPYEGATVSVDSPGLRSASTGTIRNGHVLLPYFPFLQGSTLLITATTKIKGSLSATVTLEAEAPLVELKPRKPRLDLLLGTGTGRLLGAGAEFRAYIDEGWSFLFLEDRLYAGYDFQKGSFPVIHEESWYGLGWYLFFPPSSRFRMNFSLGLGLLYSLPTVPGASNQVFFDFALLPINLTSEYSLGRDSAAWMSLRSAFSVGTGGTGLQARGWIGNGAPSVSLGMLWRRR